jgi:outer membrane lipoprotein-sorting protein
MIRRASLAAALLALLAPLASAQTLDEILAKHWAAEGGLDKIKAVQSYRMTGKMTIGPGMEAPFIMEKKRPNLMRTEFTLQGMTGVQAFDGKQGWMLMPFMGKKDPEVMPAEMMNQVEEQSEFDEPFIDSKTKGHVIELVGKQDLDGTPAWKLKVTRKNGDIDYTYMDAETFLTLKQEGKRVIRGTEMEGESLLGDYKSVDGLMIAHSIESGAKGEADHTRKLTFDKIEVNPVIDPSHFTMPAVAAPDSGKGAPAKPAAAKPATKSTSTTKKSSAH